MCSLECALFPVILTAVMHPADYMLSRMLRRGRAQWGEA